MLNSEGIKYEFLWMLYINLLGREIFKKKIYKAGGSRGFYISNKCSDPVWLFFNIHDNKLWT